MPRPPATTATRSGTGAPSSQTRRGRRWRRSTAPGHKEGPAIHCWWPRVWRLWRRWPGRNLPHAASRKTA
eukprot:4968916-Pyramimonas_sp.AAC.1